MRSGIRCSIDVSIGMDMGAHCRVEWTDWAIVNGYSEAMMTLVPCKASVRHSLNSTSVGGRWMTSLGSMVMIGIWWIADENLGSRGSLSVGESGSEGIHGSGGGCV